MESKYNIVEFVKYYESNCPTWTYYVKEQTPEGVKEIAEFRYRWQAEQHIDTLEGVKYE